jgi:hypothetical protein
MAAVRFGGGGQQVSHTSFVENSTEAGNLLRGQQVSLIGGAVSPALWGVRGYPVQLGRPCGHCAFPPSAVAVARAVWVVAAGAAAAAAAG